MKSPSVYTTVAVLLLAVSICSVVYSHCQIPCGIYDDSMRFDMMAEHIRTIEKSMKEIAGLSGQTNSNMNQIVRWVNNRDTHADALSEIITYYFLAQRVKPVEQAETGAHENYLLKLELLHKMLVSSMKCKQTTDLQHIEKLKSLLAGFKTIYMQEHKQ